MNKTPNNTEKLLKSPNGVFRRLYKSPQIEIVLLDIEISLALESDPPDGPYETMNYYQKTDNFRNSNLT